MTDCTKHEQDLSLITPLESCSIVQLAMIWGCSENKIRSIIKEHKIKTYKVGQKIMISKEACIAYLKKYGLPPAKQNEIGSKWSW
jgi:excisionase family DNA binding protein